MDPVTPIRTIQLRRPPVLVEVAGRFVPERATLEEVDARWAELCAANPRYFDGSIVQVLGTSRNGHGGVQVHVQECSYRFYAVQNSFKDCPGLDCGVRPLGVKGIAVCGNRVLMGRRSSSVAFYPGMWEFVPGGGLEPGVSPAVQVVRELAEEARLVPLQPPIAVGLLFDPVASTWEVVHRIALSADVVPEIGWEYDAFQFVRLDALPEPLAPVAAQMLALAERALR
jgi:8-oxo-dGTP pyrophosphatase MutT (NUDIX family)